MSPSYPETVPDAVPDGLALVHNHVRPARRQGERGFRFWLEPTGTANRERCDCSWSRLEHYRVARREI